MVRMENEEYQEDGGTVVYCPICKDFKECKSISLYRVGRKDSERRKSNESGDLNWYQRARHCLTCEQDFVSVEMFEDQFTDLVYIREGLEKIKADFSDIWGRYHDFMPNLEKFLRSIITTPVLKQDPD